LRLTILLTAVAAAALTACGGLGAAPKTASSPSPASPSPGRGAGGSAVSGKLVQLNGALLVVNEQAGDVKVSYDNSTMVLRTTAGSASDIAAGACVNATGQKDATGLLTADAVQVMLNMNGTCSRPGSAGGGGGSGQGRGSGAPPNVNAVSGKVASFSGTSMTVQVASGSVVTVTVPDTARITRTESAAPGQLAVGQCVRANGQKDSAGTVKARVVSIVPAGPNGCPQGRPNSASSA
jgi:hypothetical protein